MVLKCMWTLSLTVFKAPIFLKNISTVYKSNTVGSLNGL